MVLLIGTKRAHILTRKPRGDFNYVINFFQRCVDFLIMRIIFILAIFCLAGCDVLFVKRIELIRPNDPLQIKTYENNKTTIISTIDHFATNNDLACKDRQGVSRSCRHQPTSIVAFEDKNGFAICLFMLGIGWEGGQFLHLSETLEKMLNENIQGTKLISSQPDELPECHVPPDLNLQKAQ